MKTRSMIRMGAGLALVAMVAARAGGPALSVQGEDRPVSLVLSRTVMDFEDGLDARDALGRPVAAPAAKLRLQRLFIGGLYALLMRPDLPRVAEVLAFMQKLWQHSSAAFRGLAGAAWRVFLDLWSPPFRKFDPTPFLMAVGAVFLLMSLQTRRDSSARPGSFLTQLSTVVLRC